MSLTVARDAYTCTRVWIRTCAHYPRAISYRRPTDNSYLDEAVFLPIFGGGGTSSSGLCLCATGSRERSTAAYLLRISEAEACFPR